MSMVVIYVVVGRLVVVGSSRVMVVPEALPGARFGPKARSVVVISTEGKRKGLI